MPSWAGPVSWIVTIAIKHGALGAFTALTAEMVASAQGERGVLAYLRFISADGTRAFLFERYADSNAARQHLQQFHRLYATRYGALVERREFMIFGAPSTELLRELERYGAVEMKRLAGFGSATAAGT